MSDQAETPLEMARRHVAEGRHRIARQEQLIVDLERGGHRRMLPKANDLLRELWVSQAIAEEHLARELQKGVPNKRLDPSAPLTLLRGVAAT